MDKNYVHTGMLVYHENEPHLVVEKYKISCLLLNTYSFDNIEVTYDDINCCIDSAMKGYNRNIHTINCRSTSKLEKNTEKDYIFEDGSKVWFTSDTHFSHDNIIDFCQRPYKNTQEMNDILIKNWNDIVGEDDTVFHLGDFAWGGSAVWNDILSQLHGHIHLIIGNHDIKNIKESYHKYFESISFQRQIAVEGRKIYLNHYPFLTWGGIYRRKENIVWQLFGHVHSKPVMTGLDYNRLTYLLPYQYDVGVDNNDYKPINFKEVERIIQEQIEKK